MITRAQMPRQLRNKGGITNAVPREKYGLGSKLKERFRKLIPNELADIAVKAAPFVAPFNPGIAGLMRGIGRFDQRGSISDAFKQGAVTFGFGKAAGFLGGAEGPGGMFGKQTFTKEGFRQGPVGRLFQGKTPGEPKVNPRVDPSTEPTKGIRQVANVADKVFEKAPILKDLSSEVKQKLLVGGITSGASALYSYFTGEFDDPQEPGETMEEYMARRRERVKSQMRQVMDSYYTPLRNPSYAAMSDEEKNNFIDGIVGSGMATGGRVGYQTGGVTMANTLAENIRRNLANQAAVNQMFQAAASKAFPEGKFQQIKASSPTQKDYNIRSTKDLVENLPGGIAKDVLAPAAAAVLSLPYDAIQASQRMEPGSGIAGFVDAFKAENPISSLKERTTGAAGPLAERLSKIDLGMSKAAASEITPATDPTGMLPQTSTLNPDLEQAIKNAKAAGRSKEYIDTMLIERQDSDAINFFKNLTLGDGRKNSFDTTSRTDKNTYSYTGSDGKTYYTTYEGLQGYKRIPAKKGGMPVGIMRTNKAGVMERDYRDKGGFVPVGIKEKADDVPAMLSKNEFVFTADAVRGAGNGSIEKGAQKMYNTMKNLEKRVV